MESQPQNPEFRINPENFHPCYFLMSSITPKSHEICQDLFFVNINIKSVTMPSKMLT